MPVLVLVVPVLVLVTVLVAGVSWARIALSMLTRERGHEKNAVGAFEGSVMGARPRLAEVPRGSRSSGEV